MDGHNMASIPIRLTHDEVAGLAKLLDLLYADDVSSEANITPDDRNAIRGAWAKIAKTATDIVYADRARRRPAPVETKPYSAEELAFLEHIDGPPLSSLCGVRAGTYLDSCTFLPHGDTEHSWEAA
jgi:hypothetical protein